MQREEEVNDYDLEHNTDVLVGIGSEILFFSRTILAFPCRIHGAKAMFWLVACFDTHETKVRRSNV